MKVNLGEEFNLTLSPGKPVDSAQLTTKSGVVAIGAELLIRIFINSCFDYSDVTIPLSKAKPGKVFKLEGPDGLQAHAKIEKTLDGETLTITVTQNKETPKEGTGT